MSERILLVLVTYDDGTPCQIAFPIEPDRILGPGNHWREGAGLPSFSDFTAEAIAYAVNEGSALSGTLEADDDGTPALSWRVVNPAALPLHEWIEA